MRVLVTGTLGYDYIMDYSGRFADRIMPDKIHQLSLSFLVDKLNKQFGGTAGNIAYSLKLLGLNPIIVSAAGNDFAPYREFLEKHELNLSGIAIHEDVVTGSYFVVTDKSDNQIGAFYSGATRYAKDLSIIDALKGKGLALPDECHCERGALQSRGKAGVSLIEKNSVFVIISPTDPSAMVKYVSECHALSLPYLYDPAFQIGSFSPEDLRQGISRAAIFIGNDYEIALVEEKLDISHEELLLMCPFVITTLGAKGSIIETPKEAIHIKPAKTKKIIDPTGAGDAYRAGFLAGYLRKFPLAVCGQIASLAAVYTVEKYGTQTHDYTLSEFQKRFFLNYNQNLNLDTNVIARDT